MTVPSSRPDAARSRLPQITVIGLGPGDDRWVTQHTLHAIADASVRFVRTRRHPSAHLVGDDATSFDDVYDAADTFDDVYATIVDRLVTAADANTAACCTRCPGRRSCSSARCAGCATTIAIDCRVLPAISFLDLAYERLGIDPVETGLRLIDGHEFATASAGYARPDARRPHPRQLGAQRHQARRRDRPPATNRS